MIFNTANPINAVLILAATLLLVYLGKETKKSVIPQVVLFVHLALIIVHAVQFITLSGTASQDIIRILTSSMGVDFGLVIISILAYLWIDDIEAKTKKSKVVSKSLDWFWKDI